MRSYFSKKPRALSSSRLWGPPYQKRGLETLALGLPVVEIRRLGRDDEKEGLRGPFGAVGVHVKAVGRRQGAGRQTLPMLVDGDLDFPLQHVKRLDVGMKMGGTAVVYLSFYLKEGSRVPLAFKICLHTASASWFSLDG